MDEGEQFPQERSLHGEHLVLGPPEVFLDGEERGQRAWQGARTRGCISLRQSRGWQGYQPGHLAPVPVPTPLLRRWTPWGAPARLGELEGARQHPPSPGAVFPGAVSPGPCQQPDGSIVS